MIKHDFDGGASRHLFGPYDRVTIDGRADRWQRPGHPTSVLVVAEDGSATVLGGSATAFLETGRMAVEPGFHSPEAAAERLQTTIQIEEGEVQ